MKNIFGVFALVNVLIFAGVTSAIAQPDCVDVTFDVGPTLMTGPNCTISWVENNALRSLNWRAVQDDFETAQMDQTTDFPVLSAGFLPDLVDVDSDGWLDVVTFTPIGMVDGAFDIFIREPQVGGFGPVQQLFGHTLSRDADGNIVVASRNGAGTVLRFYSLEKQALIFHFEIDPYVIDAGQSDTGFTCAVSPINSSDKAVGIVSKNTDLIDYYCDANPDPARARRDADLVTDPATIDRVPRDTVFYCRLEGGTHMVQIAESQNGLRYAYGPMGGTPELVMERSWEAVAVLPENGAGANRFGEVSFVNGDYTYTAYYSFTPFGPDGALLPTDPDGFYPNDTFMRGLIVTKGNNVAAPVFDRSCLLDHSFDDISSLARNLR